MFDAQGSDFGKPILVAATPNDRGQRAIRTAASIARETKRPLMAYQILDEGDFTTSGPGSLQTLTQTCSEAFKQDHPCTAYVACFPDHYTDHEYGRAVSLVDAASLHGAALLVIGTHNVGAQRKALGGTMTHKLLQVAPCPVLIAAQDVSGPYQKVMVAVDFSPVSADLIQEAIALAPKAAIQAVHIVEASAAAEEDERAQELHKLIETARQKTSAVDIAPRIVVGDHKTTFTDILQDTAPDLVVLGTKGLTGLSRIMLGSFAARFIDNPPCDLLVLRSPR
ncbi:MAG: universal stress protein [Pseudomonadota bacterium]